MRILLSIIAFVMLSSAAHASCPSETNPIVLSDCRIDWINTHHADDQTGEYNGFYWIRIEGKIYSQKQRDIIFLKNVGEEPIDAFKRLIKEQFIADKLKEQQLHKDANDLLTILIEDGFKVRTAIAMVNILLKETNITLIDGELNIRVIQ